jgi:hypothetical protein
MGIEWLKAHQTGQQPLVHSLDGAGLSTLRDLSRDRLRGAGTDLPRTGPQGITILSQGVGGVDIYGEFENAETVINHDYQHLMGLD